MSRLLALIKADIKTLSLNWVDVVIAVLTLTFPVTGLLIMARELILPPGVITDAAGALALMYMMIILYAGSVVLLDKFVRDGCLTVVYLTPTKPWEVYAAKSLLLFALSYSLGAPTSIALLVLVSRLIGVELSVTRELLLSTLVYKPGVLAAAVLGLVYATLASKRGVSWVVIVALVALALGSPHGLAQHIDAALFAVPPLAAAGLTLNKWSGHYR